MADLLDEDDPDRPRAWGAPPWLVIALCLLALGLTGSQGQSLWQPRLRPYDANRVVPPWEEADRLAWEQASDEERQEALQARE
jgi:hypothetical protein